MDANDPKAHARIGKVEDRVIEMAEVCASILEAIEIIGQDMPYVGRHLEAARERLNKIRWPE